MIYYFIGVLIAALYLVYNSDDILNEAKKGGMRLKEAKNLTDEQYHSKMIYATSVSIVICSVFWPFILATDIIKFVMKIVIGNK